MFLKGLTQYDYSKDKLGEECGVFGFYDNDGFDVAHMTYYALYALQHRGQESAGMVLNKNREFSMYKDSGLVPEVFTERVLNSLEGTISVGHVRYSTKGGNYRENAQPLVNHYVKGTLALAHNGNLINSNILRDKLKKEGALFHTTMDSEVIMYVIAQERIKSKSIEEAVLNTMDSIKGSYSLVVMSPEKLIGARDPHGIRPLSIGKLENMRQILLRCCYTTRIFTAYNP